MKQLKFTMIILGTFLIVTNSALAYTLTEDFTGATIYTSSHLTTTTGLNQWNDRQRWVINTTGGYPDSYAQHTTGSDATDLLFYGFDATGLGAGTTFSIDFDFINQSGDRAYNGMVYFGGLETGQQIEYWAPFGDLEATYFASDTIARNTGTWTAAPTFSGTIDDDYEVLYVAFKMGGIDGLRGIDNVNLQVGPVPEPATMLLFGTGLIGLAGISIRRKKK